MLSIYDITGGLHIRFQQYYYGHLLLQYLCRFLYPKPTSYMYGHGHFLAVFLHVFVDIFNSYGTQALRPFSNKWVAIGVINTFDPIIFILHAIAIIIWAWVQIRSIQF